MAPVGDRAEPGTAAGEAGAVTELVPCCGICWDVATAKNVEAKPGWVRAGFILHQLKSPTGFLGGFAEGHAGEFIWKMPDPT